MFLFTIGFLEVSWVDAIDILLVSVLLYQLYMLMRGSVAVNIFLGILALYLIYLIVRAAQMKLLELILGQFMGVGVLAALILFQPEIRKFLLLIGKSADFKKSTSKLKALFWKTRGGDGNVFNITPVVEAAKTLGVTNTGALIVFSRDSELKFYAESGDMLNARLSKRLLLSIFNKYSPLHDGAVIVHDGEIKAARCVLPVSESDNLPAQFGLRHRAAMGMSEVTDTIVLVVSEETGQLSVMRNGKHFSNLSPQEMKKLILGYLATNAENPSTKSSVSPGKGTIGKGIKNTAAAGSH